jgi:NADPH2:quinone reductase
MRAAYYDKIGPAREVLNVGEVPTPEPGAGEVRVKLATSGVNPSDVKMRVGLTRRPENWPRIIPHSDGAGTIDKVGAGVPASRVGERVWTWNARWARAFGTAAEYVTLPAEQAVKLPSNTDFAAGACLGIPALTAWQAAVTDGGVAGKNVLVMGGAGAVGHYAVQFAKLKGAKQVIATVSSDAKAAHARAGGADATINYKTENVGERVRALTGGRGADRVIETNLSGNIKLYPQIIADYGLAVCYGSDEQQVPLTFGAMLAGNVGFRFFIVYLQSKELRAQAVREITGYLEAGKLQHAVGAHFPLRDIAAAHEAVEQGKVMGNVVVDLNS